MKHEFRKRVEVPDPNEILSKGGQLPRAAAVALIASRLSDNSPGDDERSKRQRVQSAIRCDIRNRKLKKPAPSEFILAEIVEWARRRFRQDSARFDGLPRALHMNAATGHYSTSGGDTLGHLEVELPTNLEAAHRRITELDVEMKRLTSVELELRRKIAELEPDASRWRDVKRKWGRRR